MAPDLDGSLRLRPGSQFWFFRIGKRAAGIYLVFWVDPDPQLPESTSDPGILWKSVGFSRRSSGMSEIFTLPARVISRWRERDISSVTLQALSRPSPHDLSGCIHSQLTGPCFNCVNRTKRRARFWPYGCTSVPAPGLCGIPLRTQAEWSHRNQRKWLLLVRPFAANLKLA